jgi:hypothetical protein
MAMTNHERVGKAMDSLKSGLVRLPDETTQIDETKE